MPALLIKNGRVIDPASGLDGPADVLIENGHIQAVARNLTDDAAEIFDRHLGGFERPLTAVVCIDAGLIVEDADLDALRQNGRGKREAARGDGGR